MNNTANLIRLAAVLIVVLTLQTVVFDNLDFLGLCNPFIYILFILLAPFGCPTWLLMLMAAGEGLIIDIASNTPGMHMAATILIAYLRPPVLRLVAFRSTTYKEGGIPGSHAYGSLWFARYTLIIVAIHHLALFLIEQFDSFYLWPTLIRILLSIAASTILIILIENLAPSPGGPDD